MKLRYAIVALSALMSVGVSGALPMRNAAVGELSQYTAPMTTPRSVDLVFMPDGKRYVSKSADGRELVISDIASGKETEVLVSLDRTRETTLPDFDGFALSPDASKVLLWRNSEQVYRRSFTAEFYVYEVRSRLLKPLSVNHPRQMNALFSPDSRMVAFVSEGNIYVSKLDYGTEVAVTEDAAAGKIINGSTDWTYEEEFGVTSLMTWAPDNLTLCYVRFDESAVPSYTLPIYEGTCDRKEEYSLYPGVMSYKYPVAGEVNSKVSVHSYDVETRKTKAIEFPGGAPYYIPRIEYGPKESMLMVSTLNRDQNVFELFSVNPKSTVARSIYTDKSSAWIEEDCYSGLRFYENSFVVASSESGFMRYSEYSYAGAKLKDISKGDADATAYYGRDAQGNYYYQAASPRAMDRTVYKLDAKGNTVAVSLEEGTSAAVLAPGGESMLLSYNNTVTPPVYKLCKTNGKEIRTLEDNADYASRTKGLVAAKEFFTMQGEDGVSLNGYIIKPFGFDSGKKYPVIMSQYSGPGSQQVLDKWVLDWESYYAKQGFVVVCVDGRGTGGRGTAFRTSVYKNLGHYETIDQISAARYVSRLPYVNASQIGIYGWSFGGYEALMCASADNSPYAAAVSVAPVTDWRYYDTVYTERFMLTPQQNESGYNSSSAIGRALHLSCPLLVMYGTSDDNVHPANSLQYVSTLQSAGILCDMFVFPNMNHSINGCNARAVVYARMLEFFKDKLGVK
ncbi:MAG: S9 family peptidase [Muribaculaceae bacterium]|nr:S9 family peptidase [Muribaculaceae bacterium]